MGRRGLRVLVVMVVVVVLAGMSATPASAASLRSARQRRQISLSSIVSLLLRRPTDPSTPALDTVSIPEFYKLWGLGEIWSPLHSYMTTYQKTGHEQLVLLRNFEMSSDEMSSDGDEHSIKPGR